MVFLMPNIDYLYFDELMISHLNNLWDIIVVNALAVFDVVIVVIADFARYKVTQ